MSKDVNPYRSGHNFVKNYDMDRMDERFREYRQKFETYPKRQIVSDFPIHVDLELSSMCNLRCPMCHTLYIQYPSYEAYRKGDSSAFMDFETFKRAVDEGKRYHDFSSIKLNFRGESTLHPEIDRFVRYAHDNGVLDILLNSNANYPVELNAKLVDAGLSEVAYSLDALTPETYRKVRVGGDFFWAMSVVTDMLRYKDRIRVRVSYVHQKANQHETEAFVKFWTEMGVDRILVSDVYNPAELIKNDNLMVRKYQKPEKFTCPQLWQRLVVMNNGEVYPCCHAFEGPEDLRLGNIKMDSLADLWHGEKLRMLRQTHAAGDYRKILTCSKCAYPKQKVHDEQ